MTKTRKHRKRRKYNNKKFRVKKTRGKLRIKNLSKIKNLLKLKKTIKKKYKRVQIGCTNKRNLNMKGGGVNPLIQSVDDVVRSAEGGAANLFNTFTGDNNPPSGNVTDQPDLGENL